jgi:lipopolysaccharide biosynthesis protein
VHFEITHPFHPKRGTRYVLATRRQNWGEDRVMYFDAQRRLRSILAAWTSVAEHDAFTQASAGRSWFRPDDLVRLSALILEIQRRPPR